MTDDEVPRSRTGKGPTILNSMCKKINKGEKILLPNYINIGVATRSYAKNFNNYLEVVAHERISILTYSWDHVTEHERNMI